jgi:hypothetical protein
VLLRLRPGGPVRPAARGECGRRAVRRAAESAPRRGVVHRDRFTFRIADLDDDGAAAPSRLDELAELAELRSSGVLTEAEFEAEKRRILAGE